MLPSTRILAGSVGVPSADDTSALGTVVSEPQRYRAVGDQFEGVSLEGLPRLTGQAFEAQRAELGRRPRTEDAVA